MLRPLDPDDAPVIAGWASDPAFVRAAAWARRSAHECEEHHRRIITTPPPDLLRFGFVVDGELAGYVDLFGSDPGHRELGFLIGGRERWGRGLGLRAAGAGLRHGFEVLGLAEIRAEAFAGNHRSIRILQRLGFRRDGDTEDAGSPWRFVTERPG